MSSLALIVALALAAGNADDHLQPQMAVSDALDHAAYEMAVGRVFFDATERRAITMVVFPSFQPEYTVYIVKPGDQYEHRFTKKKGGQLPPPSVIFKRTKPSIWAAHYKLLEERFPPGSQPKAADGDASFRDAKVEVEIASNPLDEETVALLERLWSAALGDVRYDDVTSLGFDGVRHHFASTAGGWRSGWVWSPQATSRPRMTALVEAGEALGVYAQAGAEDRHAKLEAVRAAARATLALFVPPAKK